MTFERTTDLELIRSILTDPMCYRRIVNDAAPPIWAFAPTLRPGVECVIASDAKGPLALFLLCKSQTDTSAQVHFSALPVTWGRSTALVTSFLEWAWKNTPLTLLIAPVPSYNTLVKRLAEKVGFERHSVRYAVGTRRGKSFDIIELHIARRTS